MPASGRSPGGTLEAPDPAACQGAPASIWELDLSAVRRALDPPAPQDLASLARRIAPLVRVRAVNAFTLELFEATGEAQLIAALPELASETARETLGSTLAAFAGGATHLEAELASRTLTGKPLELALTMIVPGVPPDDSRVLVTLRDVGAHKHAERELRLRDKTALHRSEVLKSAMLESALDAIISMDHEGRIVEFNPAAERSFGIRREDALGKPMADLIFSEELRERHRRGLERYLATGETSVLGKRIEMPAQRVDGSRFDVELTVYRVPDQEPPVFTAFLRDITERRQAEAALRESEERLARALEASSLALWDWDVVTGNVYLSAGWAEMLGSPPAPRHVTITSLIELVHPHDADRLRQAATSVIKGVSADYDVEHRVRHKSGEWVWIHSRGKVVVRDERGYALRMTGTNAEITQRKQAEARVQHLATRDALTELPNRLLLADRLNQALATARRDKSKLALLFIDLDRFKNINDSLGHHVGDVLLRVAAARLTACLRREDTVARQGGDEFIVLLPSLTSPREAAKVADKLLAALAAPFEVDGQSLHATASIGIAVFPEDGRDASALFKHSDAALYHAKEAGRNRVQFFAAHMNELARQRHELESHLRGALDGGELALHYQPRIELASGKVTAFEALLRWNNPELGAVTPQQFIPVAEDSGLILPIGRWVLAQACREARRWHEHGHPELGVAVNVSAQQLRERDFADSLARTLVASGLEARHLELEITESVIMESSKQAAEQLRALTRLGTKLAIDDFGTGYSGLSYLRRLPVDRLKIDQSFVHDIASDPGDAAIVSAVIAMSKSLGLRVVAEGVETADQLRFLIGQGCHEAQGYYFSPAVPAADAESLLRQPLGVAEYA